jgi:DNA repair protein RecN (Recombination protein N)
VLNKFSKTFVDLVGQFENQKLTTPEYQMSLLDQFCENDILLSDYETTYESYKKTLLKIEKFKEALKDKGQREDYLRFQMRELEQLKPSAEEETKLLALKGQILNKEENSKDLAQLNHFLSDGEVSLLTLIGEAGKIIDKPAHFLSDSAIDQFQQLKNLAEDFSYELSKVSLDEEVDVSIDDVLEDLDRYQKLKRKFNVETNELQSLYHQFLAEIDQLEETERRLQEALLEKESVENRLYGLATKLHRKREKSSAQLSELISTGLKELNMEGATFKIDVTKLNTLGSTGLSLVNFEAETNKGEGFFKIKDIASGGELSRILLCLRQIVASEDTINIFFFDEIDTGIGGETAVKIAKALKKVSSRSQVLAITHLAQIAREVDDIIFVEKKRLQVDDFTRTISCVSTKTGKDREEVINLLAGI